MLSSIFKWRKRFIKYPKVKNELYTRIVQNYNFNLSTICHFSSKLPSTELIVKQDLKEMFVVPKLNPFHQTQNRITKFHLLEAFLSLLLQLLHHKTDQVVVNPFKDGIENLEKELRCLLTILGDISWMMCDSHVDHDALFQNLLPQFEEVANQAGNFVHYLFFSDKRTFEEIDKGLVDVLKHIKLLKANLQSSISTSAYIAPRTSIVHSILILDSLVDDLEDLLKRGDDPIADIKDQVNLLHHELLLSRTSIHGMRSPQPSEVEELKEAVMRIGGIAHQAEYLITSFLVNDAPFWYVFNRLTDLSRKIEPIRTELQLITQKYQFGGLKVVEYFSAELPFHDKRNSKVNDIIVGFEDKETEILDQLVGGGTQSLQIISILGMPGLGKTTLTKKLYNHPLVNYTFDKLSFSIVSQTYQICGVLSTILVQIESKFGEDSNLSMQETSLVEHIYKTLKGRRYLIVLDDIWDSNVLDKLLRCFPDDGNGSRILFTSRNKDVAPPNSIIHELPFLTEEQCWELLEMKVFGSRSCPPNLQRIGKKIAAKCCGLPLTVVVIAGVLSSANEEESRWEEVRGSLASYIDGEDNSVMQILELSYKHLPDHLKPCFLYFGEFKEDEAISVGNLKRLWVAEGFIRKEKDKSSEDIAGEYLLELIDKSLVMIAKRRTDGRGAKSCVVHDLLRDLCLKKSKEESFVKYWNNDYLLHTGHVKVHRVRVIGETAALSHCQHVRSFVCNYQAAPFYFRDMRLLRVLHFMGTYLLERPTFGNENLVNLKFLVIQNMPPSIDKLVNLEYLRVETRGTIVYLPPAIQKLKKFRYFEARFTGYDKEWNTSYQINSLEYLSRIKIMELKDVELLKCSPHLRKLKCLYGLEEKMDESAYPRVDLHFLTQLYSLTLMGNLMRKGFGFPANIRKLTLNGLNLFWEQMLIVGRLEFLEVLKLYRNRFKGERWDTREGEFQKLRFLQLKGVHLSEWNVDSNEHFPELQQLILIDCKNLQEISSEIGEITTLELIEVEGRCRKSMVESVERIQEEQRDMGNEELRIIIHANAGHEKLVRSQT